MRKFAFYITTLFLIGSLTGCQNNKPASECNDLQFEKLTIDTTFQMTSNPESPKSEFKLKMDYPIQTPDSQLQVVVEQFIVDSYFGSDFSTMSPQEAAMKYCERYQADYQNEGKEVMKEYGNDWSNVSPWYNFFEHSTGEAVYCANKVLSYCVFFSIYRGGAHDFQSSKCHVLDLQTLCRVYLVDLFSPDVTPDVSVLLRQSLAKQHGCKNIAELKDTLHIFEPEEVEISDNFYVSEEGITWVFNPYEIAPFSSGAIKASLSWQQLAPYLDPECSLYRFVPKAQ